MKYTPKFKALWKGEEYKVTAIHLLEDPYVMLEPKNKKSDYEEDIYVEFSELESFYEVETKYYIKLKYKIHKGLAYDSLYYNRRLCTVGQDFFDSGLISDSYQTQFTYSEIMKLPKEIQNGLNGGLLELEEVE